MDIKNFEFDFSYLTIRCWDESRDWDSIDLDALPASYKPPSNSIELRGIDVKGVKMRDLTQPFNSNANDKKKVL